MPALAYKVTTDKKAFQHRPQVDVFVVVEATVADHEGGGGVAEAGRLLGEAPLRQHHQCPGIDPTKHVLLVNEL
jgi:hypothetical protein